MEVLMIVLLIGILQKEIQSILVTVPETEMTTGVFASVILRCDYSTFGDPSDVLVTWRYKSFCKDPLLEYYSTAYQTALALGQDPANDCPDRQRTVRVVLEKRGADEPTLGQAYQGRNITIMNNADLVIQKVLWWDSGVYVCFIDVDGDMAGSGDQEIKLIVYNWLTVLFIIIGALLLIMLLCICCCQCCPQNCCCYVRCPCCPQTCCCPEKVLIEHWMLEEARRAMAPLLEGEMTYAPASRNSLHASYTLLYAGPASPEDAPSTRPSSHTEEQQESRWKHSSEYLQLTPFHPRRQVTYAGELEDFARHYCRRCRRLNTRERANRRDYEHLELRPLESHQHPANRSNSPRYYHDDDGSWHSHQSHQSHQSHESHQSHQSHQGQQSHQSQLSLSQQQQHVPENVACGGGPTGNFRHSDPYPPYIELSGDQHRGANPPERHQTGEPSAQPLPSSSSSHRPTHMRPSHNQQLPEPHTSSHTHMRPSHSQQVPEPHTSSHTHMRPSHNQQLPEPHTSSHTHMRPSHNQQLPEPHTSSHTHMRPSHSQQVPEPHTSSHTHMRPSHNQQLPEPHTSSHTHMRPSHNQQLPEPHTSSHTHMRPSHSQQVPKPHTLQEQHLAQPREVNPHLSGGGTLIV